MKNSFTLILGVILHLTAANASPSNGIDRLLPQILKQVVTCSVRPYSVNHEGVKTYHAILSHCAEVKVTAPGVAEIKVNDHLIRATLTESANSDGDLYVVTLQDVNSGESKVANNVPAYGDILLGVLGGNAKNVMDKFVPEDDQMIAISDSMLLN